jgi:hypothetical protein
MALMKEKTALEEMLRDAGHLVEKCLELSEKSFDFACTARERFIKGGCVVKKEILTALGSNLVLRDKRLSIQALKPFFILEDVLNGDQPDSSPIEPENILMPQGRNEENDPSCPLVRGERYWNRTYEDRALRAAALIYAHFKKEFSVPPKR